MANSKERKRQYDGSPERKAKRKAYYSSRAYLDSRISYNKSPERKEYMANFASSDRARAARSIRNARNRHESYEWVASFKGSCCLDCKGEFPHYALEFDHLPGHEKLFDVCRVSRAIGPKSRAKVMLEIQKTEVVCGSCHRIRTWLRREELRIAEGRKRRRSRVDQWYASLKDAPCVDCGKKFPPCAMDWDHVDGDKIASVSSITRSRANVPAILAEIAKCVLRCKTCHMIATYLRLHPWSVPASDQERFLAMRPGSPKVNPRPRRASADRPSAR